MVIRDFFLEKSPKSKTNIPINKITMKSTIFITVKYFNYALKTVGES
jgi:hypothetical protein